MDEERGADGAPPSSTVNSIGREQYWASGEHPRTDSTDSTANCKHNSDPCQPTPPSPPRCSTPDTRSIPRSRGAPPQPSADLHRTSQSKAAVASGQGTQCAQHGSHPQAACWSPAPWPLALQARKPSCRGLGMANAPTQAGGTPLNAPQWHGARWCVSPCVVMATQNWPDRRSVKPIGMPAPTATGMARMRAKNCAVHPGKLPTPHIHAYPAQPGHVIIHAC
jgi:hypothetical protein